MTRCDMHALLGRRAAVKTLTALAGVAAVLPVARVLAADPPHLDVKDPAAVALGYVENVSQLDHKKYPDYAAGSTCENCLQLQGAAGMNYRPCALFVGKVVAVSGWCSGWTPEM